MNDCWEEYFELCRPFVLPAPWADLPVDENALQGPADPQAAWTELLSRRTPQDLLAAGIAKLVDGRPTLHPHLAAADVGLVVLRREQGSPVYNVVTGAGCVCGDTAAIFEALGDHHAQRTIMQGNSTVFMAESIADVVFLRSFGWAAAPAVGFTRLRQTDCEALVEYFGCECVPSRHEDQKKFPAPQGDTAVEDAARDAAAATTRTAPRYLIPSATGYLGKNRESLRLMLVGRSPQSLGPRESPQVTAAIEEFKRLRRYRRLALDEISIWNPTPEHLENLRFALSRGEREWVRSALVESLEEATTSLESFVTPPADRTPAIPSAQARRRLQEAQRAARFDASRRGYADALADYHRVTEQRVIDPLLEQTHQIADPFESSLYMQYIELQSLFLAAAPEVRRKTLVDLAESDVGAPQGQRHVQSWLAIGNQLLKLYKEIEKCQTRSPAAATKQGGPTWKGFPRFGNWG